MNYNEKDFVEIYKFQKNDKKKRMTDNTMVKIKRMTHNTIVKIKRMTDNTIIKIKRMTIELSK
jgi:hypothetical protein